MYILFLFFLELKVNESQNKKEMNLDMENWNKLKGEWKILIFGNIN